MEERVTHALEVAEFDVCEANPAADEGAKELEEVGVAGRLFHDLPNEREAEGAAAAGERDGESLLGRFEVEVPDEDVPKHALGVGAGALQIETERRQSAEDDPDSLLVPLHIAQSREKARQRETLASALV